MKLRELLLGSLRRQLILSVALVHTAMMTLFVWDMTTRQQVLLLERRAELAQSLAQTLANSAAGWLAARDRAGMQELVELQRAYRSLEFAMLLDAQGEVLAHTERPRLGQFTQDLPQTVKPTIISRSPTLVDVVEPVILGGHHLGWARVGMNDKILREQLSAVIDAGWLYALVAIVIGSVLALLLGNQLTAKLYAIRQVSRAVRDGGYKARVPALGNDEAGQLAQDVNHMLDALAETSQQVDAASRAKSEFLASMSHELRTPLNAIMGYAQLLTADPAVPQASQHQAQIINQAGAHLLALINDLIDLARIESGRLQFVAERVSVLAVLGESLTLATPLAQKRGINLHLEPCPGELPMVRVDPVRLRQIILNLLANAIKYNHPQGSVRLVCRVHSGRVRLQVSDTGPGIPAAKQARLFQAFDRLGAERGAVEGSGIGLVITQRITEAMGGSIGFESSEGQGSTFWVAFPLSE